jgi:hypothetical protein
MGNIPTIIQACTTFLHWIAFLRGLVAAVRSITAAAIIITVTTTTAALRQASPRHAAPLPRAAFSCIPHRTALPSTTSRLRACRRF